MCEQFNTLPSGGGLLDQDQLLVRKMMIVINAQSEKRERERENRKNK